MSWTCKKHILNKATEKGMRIKCYRNETNGTTENKLVGQTLDIKKRGKTWQEIERKKIMGRLKKLKTSHPSTHMKQKWLQEEDI
jgi:hypothetical protein